MKKWRKCTLSLSQSFFEVEVRKKGRHERKCISILLPVFFQLISSVLPSLFLLFSALTDRVASVASSSLFLRVCLSPPSPCLCVPMRVCVFFAILLFIIWYYCGEFVRRPSKRAKRNKNIKKAKKIKRYPKTKFKQFFVDSIIEFDVFAFCVFISIRKWFAFFVILNNNKLWIIFKKFALCVLFLIIHN